LLFRKSFVALRCETEKFKNVAIALPFLDDRAVNSAAFKML